MKLGLVIEESQGLQTHLNVEYDVLWEMVLPLSEDPRLYLSTRFQFWDIFSAEEKRVGIVGLGLLDVFKFTSFFGPPEH